MKEKKILYILTVAYANIVLYKFHLNFLKSTNILL